jgi:hypothetical protein
MFSSVLYRLEVKFLGLFGHKTQPKVILSYDVMMKCQCGVCPVQANSVCAKPKIAARNEMMSNMNSGNLQNILGSGMMKNMEMMKNMTPEMMRSMSKEQMQSMSDEMMKNTPKEDISKMMPKAEDMPGPYCANGVAVCQDFDFNKICICSGCQVFKDFNLKKAKPMSYFCKDGRAT